MTEFSMTQKIILSSFFLYGFDQRAVCCWTPSFAVADVAMY